MILSSNRIWEAFGLRALACTASGGADKEECVSTMARVGEGEAEDWYRQWTATAERVFAMGMISEAGCRRMSAREAYFRASTYYRVSYLPLFGAPDDPWLFDAFTQESDAFHRAAGLSEFPIEAVEVPFESTSLPGYFLRPSDDSLPRPTVLHVNGYDTNIQEMYFAHGLNALGRGYNALLLDGPGQGRNLIRDNMRIRPDWQSVVSAAVDYLLTRAEANPEQIALTGSGFGGLLALRAAAFEKRAVALMIAPGLSEMSAFHLPSQVVPGHPEIDPSVFDAAEQRLRSAATDPMTRWKILQRDMWVHGVSSLYDLLCELHRFEVSELVREISCPTLITLSESESPGNQAVALYEALTCLKHLMQFTTPQAASGPCAPLSPSLSHQRAFDWLDTTLGFAGSRNQLR